MRKSAPKNVWVIGSGNESASIRIVIGGKFINLPLILTSREDARLVMKTYPELSAKCCTIRKLANRFGVK